MTQSIDILPDFEGLDKREASQQGNYFSPGEYDVEIKRCMMRDTARSGRVFLVETTITKSSDEKETPIGSSRTWIQGQKNREIGQRAALSFLIAAMGFDVKDPKDAEGVKKVQAASPALMTKACRENSLAGTKVHVSVTKKKNQAGTGEYSLHVWSPATA